MRRKSLRSALSRSVTHVGTTLRQRGQPKPWTPVSMPGAGHPPTSIGWPQSGQSTPYPEGFSGCSSTSCHLRLANALRDCWTLIAASYPPQSYRRSRPTSSGPSRPLSRYSSPLHRIGQYRSWTYRLDHSCCYLRLNLGGVVAGSDVVSICVLVSLFSSTLEVPSTALGFTFVPDSVFFSVYCWSPPVPTLQSVR